jgi:hypothetical protein
MGSGMPTLKARKNIYNCSVCKRHIITVDRDEGTTPMFIACRVDGEPTDSKNTCTGQMASMGYPSPETWPEWIAEAPPTWEWYMPDRTEFRTFEQGMREHISKGGLVLRKIEET